MAWLDRVSTYPGRYLVTPESGGSAYYVTLALADEPTVEGAAEVIANFLQPSTSLLYGFTDSSAVNPDGIFVKIFEMFGDIDISGLEALIATETANRIAGDNTLQTNINNLNTTLTAQITAVANDLTVETSSRIGGDTTLQTNIDNINTSLSQSITNVSSNIATETTNRTNADNALQTQITDNYNSLDARATANATAISNNYTTLNNLITANATAISTETTNRQSADTLLQTNIDTVNSNLTGSITTLSNDLANEITARQTAVSALSTSISNLNTTLTAYTDTSINILRTELTDDIIDETTARQNADIVSGNITDLLLSLVKGDNTTIGITIPTVDTTNNIPGFATPELAQAVENNSGQINTMLNGLWCGVFVGENPNQVALTNAWIAIMGGSSVPIGARVTNFDEDAPNGKDYFYLNNAGIEQWTPRNISDIPTFTNNTTGVIQGSLITGNISANADGTGTVVGFSSLKSKVDNISNLYVAKTTTISLVGDISASAVEMNGVSISLTTTLANSGVTAGNYGETADITISDGGTFKTLQETVNSKGLTTEIVERIITLPNARNGLLTGIDLSTNSTVLATDSILTAIGKLQAHLSANDTLISGKENTITAGTAGQYWTGLKSWSNFADDVKNTALTGLSTATNSTVASTDSILVGIGKLQAHLSANDTLISGKQAQINGTGFVKANGTTISYDNSDYVTTTALTTALTSNYINGAKLNYGNAMFYGESSTTSGVALKTVTINSITSLYTGLVIYVKPTVTATLSNITLTLNSFDNKPVYYNGQAVTAANVGIVWKAGQVSGFAYDGVAWNYIGANDNTVYPTLSSTNISKGTSTISSVVRADYLKTGVFGMELTGISTSTQTAITSTDSILGAFGKLQGQIDNILATPTGGCVGRYNGTLSSVVDSIMTNVDATNITIVFGQIINGMILVDNNGNRGVISNYNNSTNMCSVTITQRGLEIIPTIMASDPTKFKIISIDIDIHGVGYINGSTGMVNGVEVTINADEQGHITSVSWDSSFTFASDVAGANLALTSASGTGATASIVTSYVYGNTTTIGDLEFVPYQDPLVQESRMQQFIARQFPIDTGKILDNAITGKKIADGVITSPTTGITRDENGNYVINFTRIVYIYGENGTYTLGITSGAGQTLTESDFILKNKITGVDIPKTITYINTGDYNTNNYSLTFTETTEGFIINLTT